MRLVTSNLSCGAAASRSASAGAASTSVLEVVDEKQEPLLGKEVAQALAERNGAALPQPERLRDRRQHERGIGDRRERDEEHALREVLDELGGSLQPEPGLARPSRPGERQQTHILPPQPLDDPGDLALAPDQRGRLDRQVRRPVLERSQAPETRSRSPSISSCESRCGRVQVL